jgi:hypothetical protein
LLLLSLLFLSNGHTCQITSVYIHRIDATLPSTIYRLECNFVIILQKQCHQLACLTTAIMQSLFGTGHYNQLG